jgi:hypothetical protein
VAYEVDPLSIATHGYVCDELPNDISIATHGYVCDVDGVVPPATRTAMSRYWVGIDLNLYGRHDRGG